MTERTLADALAHAQILRQFLEQSPHRGGVSEREIVLLADEAIRLQESNQLGEKMLRQCTEENIGLRQCHNLQVEEIQQLKTEIDRLKSGKFNKVATLTDQDLLGSYGE